MVKGGAKDREWGQQWEGEEEGLKVLMTNSEYTRELTELSLGSWERAMESAGTSSLDGVSSHHWRTETDH